MYAIARIAATLDSSAEYSKETVNKVIDEYFKALKALKELNVSSESKERKEIIDSMSSDIVEDDTEDAFLPMISGKSYFDGPVNQADINTELDQEYKNEIARREEIMKRRPGQEVQDVPRERESEDVAYLGELESLTPVNKSIFEVFSKRNE